MTKKMERRAQEAAERMFKKYMETYPDIDEETQKRLKVGFLEFARKRQKRDAVTTTVGVASGLGAGCLVGFLVCLCGAAFASAIETVDKTSKVVKGACMAGAFVAGEYANAKVAMDVDKGCESIIRELWRNKELKEIDDVLNKATKKPEKG